MIFHTHLQDIFDRRELTGCSTMCPQSIVNVFQTPCIDCTVDVAAAKDPIKSKANIILYVPTDFTF